ncbi:MAG TPA: ornithine cyclodeaminase family protein [Bryobacteraceae bacterium]|nr:ornithine cyclodeaminase family protein [Bryobacteraceae bacterium]
MMIHISEQQVREVLSMQQAIGLMRDVFAALREGKASNQPRRRIVLPTGSTLHSMGGAWGKYFGTKFYSTNPKYGSHFFCFLFDAETAQPLAQLEANWLGQIRTGAASGYATDVLAAPHAATLAVIGSGFQAASQITAIREVRNLKDIRVWSRSEEKRNVFAQTTGARAVASAEEAVRGADIVVTATFAGQPVIDSAWIADGAHVNAMGSNRGNRRELPTELIQRANLIAIDSIEQGKIEAGDLLMAGADWTESRIVELAQVTKRPAGNPVTIFKSVGLGVEDVIAAAWVYEKLTGA